jgi:predicted nucleotidyltransferase
MDSQNPLRSLAPTVDADVLAVLARSHLTLTGRRVQQLSTRSYAQVRAALHRLVAHGLVDAQRHGQAVAYSLNREHVLAAAIETASDAAGEVERRLRSVLAAWAPAPTAAVLFGSFARREGGPDSDIDLMIVRPDAVAEDDVAWTAQRYDLARRLERWTGNGAQIVELTSAELAEAATEGEHLIAAIREDGRVLVGPRLQSLLAAP